MEDRYDVLVVGSGPAGSIAALVLARGGARVALVDKAAFPATRPVVTSSVPRASACWTNSRWRCRGSTAWATFSWWALPVGRCGSRHLRVSRFRGTRW